MKRFGFVDGPFQLLVNVIVLGMALSLGYYLYDNALCFQCNINLDSEILELREAITFVGKGNIGTRTPDTVNIENLGSCAKAIYIKQLRAEDGSKCEKFCPKHLRNCWVIYATRRCGENRDPAPQCIDIAGDTIIKAEAGVMPEVTDQQGYIFRNAMYLSSTKSISITKTGTNEITIARQ